MNELTVGGRGGKADRRLFLLILGAAAALALGTIVAFHVVFRGSVLTDTIGGPFRLVDGRGHPVTDRSWPGRTLLVYFGYTNCPDACPTTLAAVGAALDRLGRAGDRVQPLFITVDPRRDTAAVIGAYARAFSPRIVGLTGSEDAITHAAREYGVMIPDAEEMRRSGYTVEHGHGVYVMAPDGHFITEITAVDDPAAIASDLRQALRRS